MRMSWLHFACAYLLLSHCHTEAQTLSCPTSSIGRIACGVSGVTQSQCETGGINTVNKTRCCFDSSCTTCPWCYFSSDSVQYTCPLDNPTARIDCGYGGITEANCNGGVGTNNNTNCCWDTTAAAGLPWCYLPTVMLLHPTTTIAATTAPVPASDTTQTPAITTTILATESLISATTTVSNTATDSNNPVENTSTSGEKYQVFWILATVATAASLIAAIGVMFLLRNKRNTNRNRVESKHVG